MNSHKKKKHRPKPQNIEPYSHQPNPHHCLAQLNDEVIEKLQKATLAKKPEKTRLHHEVILAHIQLANAIARKFSNPSKSSSDDLRQVAYIGLIKSVKRFDPFRGKDLISFLVPTITGEVKRYLRDSSWLIRPPRKLEELHQEVTYHQWEEYKVHGFFPSTQKLASLSHRTEKEIKEVLQYGFRRQYISLDTPPSHSEDTGGTAHTGREYSLIDTLSSLQNDFEEIDLSIAIDSATRSLTGLEKRILYFRFYLEQTQEEIALRCQMSQAQVSRMLHSILKKLREETTLIGYDSV